MISAPLKFYLLGGLEHDVEHADSRSEEQGGGLGDKV
jgi:hypothetical protein